MVVSVTSTGVSNEVVRDLEKEGFGDVQADETLVVDDETDVVLSKEPKVPADSDSKPLSCAGRLV